VTYNDEEHIKSMWQHTVDENIPKETKKITEETNYVREKSVTLSQNYLLDPPLPADNDQRVSSAGWN
jgi:hypothetical protein